MTATPRLWQLDEDQEPGGVPGKLVASTPTDRSAPAATR